MEEMTYTAVEAVGVPGVSPVGVTAGLGGDGLGGGGLGGGGLGGGGLGGGGLGGGLGGGGLGGGGLGGGLGGGGLGGGLGGGEWYEMRRIKPESETYTLRPKRSTAIPVGYPNPAFNPSPSTTPYAPFPASVDTVPSGSPKFDTASSFMNRITLFCWSATYLVPTCPRRRVSGA
jgi:hypothetical protein